MSDSASLLDVTNLAVEFRVSGEWIEVVDHVSFSVEKGEIVGVVGESGSGKSVTMLGVLNLIPDPGRVSSGSVLLSGEDLLQLDQRGLASIRGAELSLIPADAGVSLNPVARVGKQVEESLKVHCPELDSDARKQRVLELLERVGLSDPAKLVRSYPHELSGGMQQRVVVAIGIASNPSVLIADEPTTALDVTIQAQILELLLGLRSEFQTSLLFVTHDITTVAEICDRVLVMYAGQFVETGSAFDVCTSPRHPYTRALLSSVPPLGGDVSDRLVSIQGAAPDPGTWPMGCRFADRCWLRRELNDPVQCISQNPGLVSVDDAHMVACHFSDEMDRSADTLEVADSDLRS